NEFYRLDVQPGFNLNPEKYKAYGERYEDIGKFLFDIASLTGEVADKKAYPDIETFAEIAIKVYDLKDEIQDRLNQLGNYRFDFNSQSNGFGYLIRGGIVTIFVYDEISLPVGLDNVALARYAITLVPAGMSLQDARLDDSQDSQLIKQVETIVNISVRQGGDLSGFYAQDEIGSLVGFYAPEGRLLWSEMDYYSTIESMAGRLERQIRGNRETIYEYNDNNYYYDSRQMVMVPIPSAGRTVIAGTNTLLSEFTIDGYNSGDEWVNKTIRFYDGNGRVSREEKLRVATISGATWLNEGRDKIVINEYDTAAQEVLGMPSSYTVIDKSGEILQSFDFVDYSTNNTYQFGGAIYEGRDYATQTYSKEVTDFLGRVRVRWNGLRNSGDQPVTVSLFDYDSEYFAAFDKATRVMMFLSDTMGNSTGKKISESELITARGFNELGGVDYFDTNSITGLSKVSVYGGEQGLLMQSYSGELGEVYVAGRAIYAQIVDIMNYDDEYFRARNASSHTDTYIWNNYAQATEGAVHRYSEPVGEIVDGVLQVKLVNNDTGLERFAIIILDTGRVVDETIPERSYTEYTFDSLEDLFSGLAAHAKVNVFDPATGDYSILYSEVDRESFADGRQQLTSKIYYNNRLFKTQQEERVLGIDYSTEQVTRFEGEDAIVSYFEYNNDTRAKLNRLAWGAYTMIDGELFDEMSRVGGVENSTTRWEGKQFYRGQELRDVTRIQDYATGATLQLDTQTKGLRTVVDFGFDRDGQRQVIDMFVNLANEVDTDFIREDGERVKLETAIRQEGLQIKADGTMLVVWDVDRFYSRFSTENPFKTIERKHQLATGAYESEDITMFGHTLSATYDGYESTIHKFINLPSETSMRLDGMLFEQATRTSDVDLEQNEVEWRAMRYHRIRGLTREYTKVVREFSTGATIEEILRGQEVFLPEENQTRERTSLTRTIYSYSNLEDKLASMPSYFKGYGIYGEETEWTEQSEGIRNSIDFANQRTIWYLRHSYGMQSTQSLIYRDILSGGLFGSRDMSTIGTMRDAERQEGIDQSGIDSLRDRLEEYRQRYQEYINRQSSSRMPVSSRIPGRELLNPSTESLMEGLDAAGLIDFGTPLNFTVLDPAKPRLGYTEAQVISEVEGLITSGNINDVNIFTVLTINDPIVEAVLRYYRLTGQREEGRRLTARVNAGQLRRGQLTTAYSANLTDYLVIASNDNPDPAAVLIHENNLGTHDENLEAENQFITFSTLFSNMLSGFRGVNFSYAPIGAGQKDMRSNSDIIAEGIIKAIAATGFGAQRTYFAPEPNLLDTFAANNQGVVVGFPFMDDRQFPTADILNNGYLEYVRDYMNHPAVLAWELTNEPNEQSWFRRDMIAGLREINEAAANIKAIDPNHPISVTFSRRNYSEIARQVRAGALSNVDVIGITLYDWLNDPALLDRLNGMFGKPVYIAEFGETSVNSERQQAINNMAMWRLMDEAVNRGSILGAFGFSAIDEWYKGFGSYFRHDRPTAGGMAEEWFGYFKMQVRQNADGTYTTVAVPKETLIWQYSEWNPTATALPAEFDAIELPNISDLDDPNHPFMQRIAVNTYVRTNDNIVNRPSESVFGVISNISTNNRGDFSDRSFDLSRETWTFFVEDNNRYLAERARRIGGVRDDPRFGQVTVWHVQQFDRPENIGVPAQFVKEFVRVQELATGTILWEIAQEDDMRIKSVYDHTAYDDSGEIDLEKTRLHKYMRRSNRSWTYYDRNGAIDNILNTATAFQGDWVLYEQGSREDLIYMGEANWDIEKVGSDKMFSYQVTQDVATGAMLIDRAFQQDPVSRDFNLIKETLYDYDKDEFALFLNMSRSSNKLYLDVFTGNLRGYEVSQRNPGIVDGNTVWQTSDSIEGVQRTDTYNSLGLMVLREFGDWKIENYFERDPTLQRYTLTSRNNELILRTDYPAEEDIDSALGHSVSELAPKIIDDWNTVRGMVIDDETRVQPAEVTQYFYSSDLEEGRITNNWTHYRVSGDPFARTLIFDHTEHELYKSIVVNWDIKYPLRSYRAVFDDTQITHVYENTPTRVEAQDAIPLAIQQKYLEIYGHNVWDDLSGIDISESTELRVVKETPFYLLTDPVTDEDYYSSIEATPTYRYLLSDDPLGRIAWEYFEIDKDEYTFAFEKWWLQDDSNNRAPFGISPGSIAFEYRELWSSGFTEIFIPDDRTRAIERTFDRIELVDSGVDIVYRVSIHKVLLEEQYSLYGRLIRQRNREVKHWFKESPILITSNSYEDVHHDHRSTLPYPEPISSDLIIIKNGVSDIRVDNRLYGDIIYSLQNKNRYITQFVIEHEAQSPERIREYKYYFDIYGRFQGKELYRDSLSISPSWQLAAYIAIGIVVIVVIWHALRFLGLSRLVGAMKNWGNLIRRRGDLFTRDTSQVFAVAIQNLEAIEQELNGLGINTQVIQDAITNLQANQTADLSAQAVRRILEEVTGAINRTVIEIIGNRFYDVGAEQGEFGPQAMELKAFVRRLTENSGYYLPLLEKGFSWENLRKLRGYGADIRGFERWLHRSGISEDEQNILREYFENQPFLSLIIFEMLEDEIGQSFRTESKNVRYYYLAQFVLGQIDIYQVRTESRQIEEFLLAQYESGISKYKQILVEDMEGIAANVTRMRNFLAQGMAGNMRQRTLARKFKAPFDMPSMFNKDFPFLAAIKHQWAPLVLIFITIALNVGAAIILNLPLAVTTAGLLSVLKWGIGYTLGMIIVGKIVNWINSLGDKTESLSDRKKPLNLFFWLFTIVVLISSFMLNVHIASWSYKVVVEFWKVSLLGIWLYAIPLAIFGTLVVLLTIRSLYYLLQIPFSYFASKEIGKGEVKIGQLNKSLRALARAREKLIQGNWNLSATRRAKGSFSGHLGTENSRITYFDNLWKRFINLQFTLGEIDKTARDSLLGFNNPGKNGFISEDADERIVRFAEGWLMDLPPALMWMYIIPYGVYISGQSYRLFTMSDQNKKLGLQYEDEGSSSPVTHELPLNLLIRNYRSQWENVVDNIDEIIAMLANQGMVLNNAVVIPQEVKDDLKRLQGMVALNNLPSVQNLQNANPDVYNVLIKAIEYWAERKTGWSPGKQLYEATEVIDTFQDFTRMCFPEGTQDDIDYLVKKKVEVMIPGKADAGSIEAERLDEVLRAYPDTIEIVLDQHRSEGWNVDAGEREVRSYVPPSPDFGRKISGGKPRGQAGGFPNRRVLFLLYTDTNSGFMIEEVARLPFSLSQVNEFINDDKLTTDLLSYGERVFHKNLTVEGKAANWSDETWVIVVQRFFSRCGAVSFYGHPGGAHTTQMKAINSQPQDRPSEDIVLGWRMFINGFKTHMSQHILAFKQRPPSFLEDTGPKTKFSAGGADLLNSVVKELMGSKIASIAQKYINLSGLFFYPEHLLIVAMQFFYVGWILFLGVSGYVAFPYNIGFGLLGVVVMAQAITGQQWLLLTEKYGLASGTVRWFLLMPLNFVYFVAMLIMYAAAFINGLLGKADFKSTEKAMPVTKATLKELVPQRKLFWTMVALAVITSAITVFISIPGDSSLILFAVLYGIQFIVTSFFILYSYKGKELPVGSISIMAALLFLPPTFSGIIIWSSYQLIWSITYVLFVFV
ncbi:hypothetical protein ACFL2J_07320, partial [Candidatus Omnitrophota bacterium]